MNVPQNPVSDSPPIPADWTPLPDEHVPPPTFWPAGLALGITFLLWGLITSWVVFVVGLVTFGVALAGWILNICHEQRNAAHS